MLPSSGGDDRTTLDALALVRRKDGEALLRNSFVSSESLREALHHQVYDPFVVLCLDGSARDGHCVQQWLEGLCRPSSVVRRQ